LCYSKPATSEDRSQWKLCTYLVFKDHVSAPSKKRNINRTTLPCQEYLSQLFIVLIDFLKDRLVVIELRGFARGLPPNEGAIYHTAHAMSRLFSDFFSCKFFSGNRCYSSSLKYSPFSLNPFNGTLQKRVQDTVVDYLKSRDGIHQGRGR